MTNPTTVHLSLIENSQAFLKEAVEKVLAARADLRQWQFAITALVQSLELSLKELLRRIHPVLIYENIDAPKNTIRPSVAIERLENPKIGNMTFTASEKVRIQRAVELRNQITHSEFELKLEYAAAKFFELFAFIVYFQGRYLDTEIESIVSEDRMAQLISIEKALEELYQKALRRIEEEKIDNAFVWACPDCSRDTFVIKDGIDTCYTCRHREPVVECPYCESLFYEWQMESFFEDLDTDYEEGRTVIHNNYGYNRYSACPDCLPKIKDDIQRQRDIDGYYRAIEESHYRKS
ncbi:MAG: hypothetical protein ACLQDF_10580 [Desulfomonilia bacterium]